MLPVFLSGFRMFLMLLIGDTPLGYGKIWENIQKNFRNI